MKPFMDEDFLLETPTARTLYHEYAKEMPIVDYHCHVPPQEIAEDRRFENMTQVWLGGDHYKWRMIRSNGVPEKEITGDVPDRVKFQRFAEALPRAIGNPMYHWTHLELKTYFGYTGTLNGDTAEEVWQLGNAKLQERKNSVRGLISQSRVAVIGTTDDPVDSLEWHKAIAADGFATKVVPSFRPDKALNIEKPGFAAYIGELEKVSDRRIHTPDDVMAALADRMDRFEACGCRAADHGLDYVMFRPTDRATLNEIFEKGMIGTVLTEPEIEAYKTALLLFCAREYARRGWVMQIHYGTMRNTNARMFRALGPDAGFDCIANRPCCEALRALLSELDAEKALPKTVLYSLNPGDNAMLGALIGAFQSEEVPGKIQHGAAWWFNDTKTGMQQQMMDLANLSILGNFIGMLTDSRSFLSYVRHDYFRRILCNLIGGWVENGEYPADKAYLGQLVQDISFNNAKRYFGF